MYIVMLISSSLFKIPLQWNYRTKNRLLRWRNSPLLRKPHFPQWIPKVACIRGCKTHSNATNSSSATRTKWRCTGATLRPRSWSTTVRATCPVRNHWCNDNQKGNITVNLSNPNYFSLCDRREIQTLWSENNASMSFSIRKHTTLEMKSRITRNASIWCKVIDWDLIWLVPKKDFSRIK